MILYATEPDSPVVELTVDGRVTDAELQAVLERLREDLDRNGKTRVLEVIRHFDGIEPRALWTDLVRGLPLIGKVGRVAVVADQGWIRAAARLGRVVVGIELEVFEPAEIERARRWIVGP